MTPVRRSPFTAALLYAFYDGLFALFLLFTAPWFALRAARDRGLRESLRGRFGFGARRAGGRPCVWVHGVSVGELKAARLLIERLATARPGHDVVISSTTSAGFALARSLFPAHQVVQFPLDFRFAMRRALDGIRPDLIVLVELEIWPNLLREAGRRGVRVVVVNGRVSARSFSGYRLLSRLLPQFELIERYAVQNEEYAGRLRALGVPAEQVEVTGNLKYDTLQTGIDPALLGQARAELGFAPDARVVVAGSTHAGEESLLLELLPGLEAGVAGVRLVLAPRHVERAAEVVRAVERAGRRPVLLSELRARGHGAASSAVVIVDTIGELERFYGLGDAVFVGGSLVPGGGHNMLEPAALGRPTLFGPHTDNFAEEVKLLCSGGGGLQVADAAELGRELARLLADPAAARALGQRGRDAIRQVRGGTARSLDLVLSLLDRAPLVARSGPRA